MRAEIIAVGSELLSFSRTETNSLFIASKLIPLGFEIPRKWVVGDREGEIRAALQAAADVADVVIVTGGLGPTNDDITREVTAAFLGRSLKEDSRILAVLEERYGRFGLRLTENNRKQAQVPESAHVIPNPQGTAPGLLLVEGKTLIFLLPGPPRELYPMVDAHVLPLIQQHKKTSKVFSRQLKVAGEAESRVDSRIENIYKAYPEVETTILSSPGIISLYFVWKGDENSARADQTLDELSSRVESELGESVFTRGECSLAEVLGNSLRKDSLTLATAESCTGGWISKMLTDVPGSSDYFLGGVVCYSNAIKESLLGVPSELLAEYGAVSEEVASSLARGVQKLLRSDIGLAVTGIAGPGGGTEEKPVGTVFLGLALGNTVEVRKLSLPGDRDMVRKRTSNIALDWLRRRLL